MVDRTMARPMPCTQCWVRLNSFNARSWTRRKVPTTAAASRRLQLRADQGRFRLHLTVPSGLLFDVIRWQSASSNSLIEDFLFHRKGDPFFRRIWIDPQIAKLIDHILFVLCHPLALE